jgi:hypothetical protein
LFGFFKSLLYNTHPVCNILFFLVQSSHY